MVERKATDKTDNPGLGQFSCGRIQFEKMEWLHYADTWMALLQIMLGKIGKWNEYTWEI